MADVHEPEVRSYNMSRIRSKNTRIELSVRSYLHKCGFRFRIHSKKLPGKPDVVLPKYKTVIFIHGCFWHGHENCRYFKLPKSRSAWWKNKIEKTIDMDRKNVHILTRQGWKVIVIWECEVKAKKYNVFLLREILRNATFL